MPRYKLEPLPKPDKKSEAPEVASNLAGGVPDQWRRTISIPVNDEILQSLKVGDSVTVELIGQVTGTRDTESKSENHEHIDKGIELMITEVYPAGDAEEREEAGMEDGYKRG